MQCLETNDVREFSDFRLFFLCFPLELIKSLFVVAQVVTVSEERKFSNKIKRKIIARKLNLSEVGDFQVMKKILEVGKSQKIHIKDQK